MNFKEILLALERGDTTDWLIDDYLGRIQGDPSLDTEPTEDESDENITYGEVMDDQEKQRRH